MDIPLYNYKQKCAQRVHMFPPQHAAGLSGLIYFLFIILARNSSCSASSLSLSLFNCVHAYSVVYDLSRSSSSPLLPCDHLELPH